MGDKRIVRLISHDLPFHWHYSVVPHSPVYFLNAASHGYLNAWMLNSG